MSRTHQLWDAITRTYPVKLYQWIALNVAVLTLVFGAIWGAATYVNDRSADAQRSADLALYEGAHDEWTRCTQRVDARTQIRGAFLDVYDLIDDISPGNNFTPGARAQLDATYPALAIGDCPPEPTPPNN